MFQGVLPYDEAKGDAAQVMGRFQSFVEALFHLDTQLVGCRSLRLWTEMLNGLLEQFLAPEGGGRPTCK